MSTIDLLLDFYELVKAIAEEEQICLDAAAREAARIWASLEADPPAFEVTPTYATADGLALAA